MTVPQKLERESNRDFAFRAIRENIVNLELKPGSMVSEQEIADVLNLSRTPVHEALQEIALTGIIKVVPQKGSYVCYINMDYVDEAIFCRSTLESAITELACKKATDDDISKLEENISLQEFYVAKGNVEKFMELDNEFHHVIYQIANKSLCYRLITMVNIHHDRIRELHLHSSNPAAVLEEHKAIVECFRSHDGEKAKDLIVKHLNKFYLDADEIKKKYSKYFEN